jgi:hypothetical protein
MIRPRPYPSGRPVITCERRAARISGVYASNTPSLWVLRYRLKIWPTQESAVKPYASRPFSTIRRPPAGMIARRSGASVCRPTMSS